MSNYNTTLQSNNIDLQAILDSINELPEAGKQLPTLTNPAEASQILLNEQAIDAEGNIITGTMPNNGAISKTFDGLTTKSYTVPAGYTSGGTVSLDNTIDTEVDEQADLIAQIKSTVDNLPEAGSGTLNLQDKTVTPTVSTQTITADSGYDGLDIVTVNGDSNLVAGNIKSGVSIFGVSGNYEGVSSGGGSVNAGEWIHVASLPTTYYAEPEGITYYLEIPSNTICLLIIKDGNYYPYWRESLTSNNILWRYTCLVTASFIESDGSLFFQMTTYATGENMYVLPIYAK